MNKKTRGPGWVEKKEGQIDAKAKAKMSKAEKRKVKEAADWKSNTKV